MSTFTVRTMTAHDGEALLTFETYNHLWFESHIDARPQSFYSIPGVTDHIEGYLSAFANGAWHPFVIEHSNAAIVGRANLKNINAPKGSAQVGYRIDQRYCGQGLATLALQRLIHEAKARWGLTQLCAHVYTTNIGSRKVLERCGFRADTAAMDLSTNERRLLLSI
ncbi:GNAT family N-acetyltransferase [Pseudomonas sp. RIT-PI-S]|uniref:GNAT family N-acetyltransferase n=1 Tax=Pseudomonas sp. RIT-PI-S TaxID=3035295 RepID=UPI0021D9A01A|nr:GNAT family N-acetyltransferase [Pseudomonas sp. RIT-PI-S]